MEERRRRAPPHAVRPEVGGVPADRAGGPGGERPECARGEDTCQLEGRRDIPEQPRPENWEAVLRDADPVEAAPATSPRPPAQAKPRARVASTSGGASSSHPMARHSAPHRVHWQSAARRPPAGRRAFLRRRGRTWTRRWRLPSDPLGTGRLPVRLPLPLIEVIVTRRGVRQEHETTVRRCPPALGQILLARAPRAIAVPRRARPVRILRHFRRRSLAAKHYRAVPSRRRCALPGGRRAPRRSAPSVASPDGEGTTASWLAASMAQMRNFICRAAGVPLRPHREEAEEFRRLGRDRGDSVRRGESLPISEGWDVAVPRRAQAPGHQDGHQ